jgi:two-component system OmpR family response regulator
MNQDIHPAVGDVLVVDDDPMIISLVTELLTDEGYSVRSACNGLEAWHAIEAALPTLLLTDIRMPIMTGTELVRRLRAAGYDFPIVIIAATPALAEPLLKLDRIEYMAKPFELELLLDGVARYVVPSGEYSSA